MNTETKRAAPESVEELKLISAEELYYKQLSQPKLLIDGLLPNGLAVLSGDSKIGKIAAVPITTAHLHYKTAGSEAAKMLLSAIKQPDLIPRILQLDFYIIERRSTEKSETV